jgi:hypothetical protein
MYLYDSICYYIVILSDVIIIINNASSWVSAALDEASCKKCITHHHAFIFLGFVLKTFTHVGI